MKLRTFLPLLTLGAVVLVGCTTPKDKQADVPASDVASTEKVTISSSSTTSTTNETGAMPKLTVEQALAAFAKEYPDAAVTSLSLDTSFGNYYYEVEGVDDEKEYQISMDATSGSVKKEKEESLDQEERNGVKKQEDALTINDLLPLEKVSELAEKAAEKGKSEDWTLDKEAGVTYWEVKVVDGTTEKEVKIQASTGEVLSVEVD